MLLSFMDVEFMGPSIYFVCIAMNLWAIYNTYVVVSIDAQVR